MGWLKKKLKAAAKWVWTKAKAVVRLAVRIALTFGWGLTMGLPDLLLGFILPAKKLRLHVFILVNPHTGLPVATPEQVQPSIDFAKKVFKDRLNVKVVPYGRQFIELIDVGVPDAALDVHCGLSGAWEDFGDAGEFFAGHLAGWNATPVSGTFPITAFIVKDVHGKGGCTPIGPLVDYVTVDPHGLSNETHSTLAHELGHACNQFWHSLGRSNLMWGDHDRGDTLHWWQRNLMRASRHVLWW